jgi:hypothetical protein
VEPKKFSRNGNYHFCPHFHADASANVKLGKKKLEARQHKKLIASELFGAKMVAAIDFDFSSGLPDFKTKNKNFG